MSKEQLREVLEKLGWVVTPMPNNAGGWDWYVTDAVDARDCRVAAFVNRTTMYPFWMYDDIDSVVIRIDFDRVNPLGPSDAMYTLEPEI